MDNTSSKNQKSKLLYIMAYALLVLALSASIFLNYIYFQEHGNPMENTNSTLTSEALPEKLRAHYVEKSLHTALTQSCTKIKQEKEALAVKLANVITTAVKERVKDEQPLKVTATARMAKDSLQCSNMNSGGYEMSKTCKKNIINYVKKHKNAKYFEIIGIVDSFEFKLFSALQKNDFIHKKLGVSQKTLMTLKKYSQMGLAKYRANEASWVIKSFTKQVAQTYSSHYKLVSKKGSRGVLVRAYE